jgi:hypothetical protein
MREVILTNTWFQKFIEQVGPELSAMPSRPHRGFSDKVAKTLWAIERIEQRAFRRDERRRNQSSHDSLEF